MVYIKEEEGLRTQKKYDKIILSGGLGNGYALVRDDVASDKKGSYRNWLVETVLYRERKHLS